MTISRLQRTAAAAAALAFPASLAFFAPQAQAEAPADPYGPACASVPKEGAGSLEGMAKDPVATAASNNPELSTLVEAVKKADLVDTLNNAENITVFAPTNAAFEKIPQADLEALLNDKDQLTKVLTYHVVGEKVTTQQMEDGTFKTLEGSDLTTKGSGTEFTVNDSSKIVCGNVPTANATVNLVDTVLMPPSS
ncbi:fasciclin domain-containing protein [Streptomyces globisporus]|uniref:FAS1 domain-containing protein n=1 Tax=Streptomyces globisporus TaxID=1908 RepID=A0ABM9H0A2_STRGL|nr:MULTISPECIES: fasciclin domain-containing protein [Streptomyces]PPA44189.1 beta-Ig-H3/fasciclin [Streptomyces griseus]RAN21412.1 beta-Ig-H3/fasciclin [Streptomyces badius]AWL90261.1 fasciclin domain-containing protein [Streptomyces globisporus]RAN29349.1 beta-Ig-H3/fasciclin [Streptomyces badius]RDL07315.1 putative surface protein with fasciclin (FAS1) repeats [Streptomyces sp. HB202]